MNSFGVNALERYLRVRPADGADLLIDSGITVQNDPSSYFTTLGDPSLPITIAGTVIAQSGQASNNSLRVTGSSVTNNGALQVDSAVLDIDNLSGNLGTALINGGSLDLDGNYVLDKPVSVPDGSLSLRGQWSNDSVIDQAAGQINLYDSFTVADLGTFTGTGGTVSIVGTLDDVGATLPIDSERTWQVAGGVIRGAQIVDDGDGDAAGTLQLTSADGTLDGVILSVDTTLQSGAVVTVLNDLTLDQTTLHLNRDGGSNTPDDIQLNFDGGSQTLGGVGTVELFNGFGVFSLERYVRLRPTNGGQLTIGPQVIVQNDPLSHFTTIGDSTLPLVVAGTIISQSTQASNSDVRLIGSSITNSGTLRSTDGLLDLATTPSNFSAGMLTGGRWEASGGGDVRLPAGNVIDTVASAIVLDGAGSFLEAGAGVDAIETITSIAPAGDLTIQNGHDFTTVGAFTNDGALTVGGGTSFIVPAGDSFVSSGVTIVNGRFDQRYDHRRKWPAWW